MATNTSESCKLTKRPRDELNESCDIRPPGAVRQHPLPYLQRVSITLIITSTSRMLPTDIINLRLSPQSLRCACPLCESCRRQTCSETLPRHFPEFPPLSSFHVIRLPLMQPSSNAYIENSNGDKLPSCCRGNVVSIAHGCRLAFQSLTLVGHAALQKLLPVCGHTAKSHVPLICKDGDDHTLPPSPCSGDDALCQHWTKPAPQN